jgi:hypothetical protein
MWKQWCFLDSSTVELASNGRDVNDFHAEKRLFQKRSTDAERRIEVKPLRANAAS